MENAEIPSPTDRRILSIDALRGFDMFWITGGAELFIALAAWLKFPGWESFSAQFEHVEWEGFRFYDLIFPLFLFVVGVVLPISLSGHHQGQSRWMLYRRIVRRTVLLFLLGLVYNEALKFDPNTFRMSGVLQRIAIVYFFCALLVLHLPIVVQALVGVILLGGYWWILTTCAAPGFSPGDFTMEGNFAAYVDRLYLPGVKYYKFGDNEGILSTIPAIATGILGVLSGHWLRGSRSGNQKSLGLFLAGLVCLAGGYGWGISFPIIKNIWTSSFVLVAGGWSLLLLALFHHVIDVLGFRKSVFFFTVIGANPITIYLLQEFVDFPRIANFFFGGLISFAATSFQPFAVALSIVLVKWLLLLFLYRKKIFLRV
ncbi:MAG: DUF5009 domain-containing protein [Planctomycetota bacterium]